MLLSFTDKGNSNSDTDKIMARMDAMTLKMDALYKELMSNAKKPKLDLDEDDIPMSREEEANIMQTFSKNDQASIQNLETKFDRLADKQSGRPSGSLPINQNDQQNDSETTINFDSDNEDEEPTPQPNLKPVKETQLPKPYKLKIPYPQRLRKEKWKPNTEDFNALLDEGSKILHSIKGTLLEEEIILLNFDDSKQRLLDESRNTESQTKITIRENHHNTDYKIKTSLEEPPTDLELKPLPDNLEYVFLEEPFFLPVIISSQFTKENKNKLIQLLDDKKPVVQKQRRLNPNMQEVVKKEIIKLLDTRGIILSNCQDRPLGIPIHCIPKKGGIIVVTNENDELVPTRTVTGWQVCIDYHKLNEATTKDHFPLPFMDQMLERLVGNKYLCFLDGFSRYFQISIDPNDQEKITFICPFGTYAYRRMPFGLCNATVTFQRCMLAIFHYRIEESVEVFMDDFSVFGTSFETCLNNHDKMLQCCKDAHLVLNWEKCHFMVKEGIVLRHKVSSTRLEVDKAKIDVI
ncbi:reverse transcriptase domain-containing protein [Tanacetum coccineum]